MLFLQVESSLLQIQSGKEKKIPIWPYKNNNRILPSNFLNFIKNYLPSKPVESSEWQSAWEELRQNINDNWKKLPEKGKLSFKKKLNLLGQDIGIELHHNQLAI